MSNRASRPASARPVFTPREYLAIDREAATKSEYHNGEIIAMAGASRHHDQVSVNTASVLHLRLRGSGCRAHSADMRTGVQAGATYFYPDFALSCADRRWEDDRQDVLLNPIVVVEVLSKSTARYDRLVKLPAYQGMPSVRHILLVEQGRVQVHHHFRKARKWTTTTHTSLDDVVKLSAVNCSITLAEIYCEVQFD